MLETLRPNGTEPAGGAARAGLGVQADTLTAAVERNPRGGCDSRGMGEESGARKWAPDLKSYCLVWVP